ncbi:hypothetical protein [Cellulomonas sp. URHB0016]
MSEPVDEEPDVAEFREAVAGQLWVPRTWSSRPRSGSTCASNLSEAHWLGVLTNGQGHRAIENHVVLDPVTRTMQITDDHVEVRRSVGGPSAGGLEVSRTVGRVWEVSHQKTWRRGADGKPEVVSERRFTTAEAHELIRGVATELGWTEKAESYRLIALLAAGVGAAAMFVAALLLLFGRS